MPLTEPTCVGEAPCARSGHSCTAVPAELSPDGATECLVFFGGFLGLPPGANRVTGNDMLSDLHVLVLSSPPRWSQLRPATEDLPPPRALHAACLVGSELVVTGGWGGGAVFDDTWLHVHQLLSQWVPASASRNVR